MGWQLFVFATDNLKAFPAAEEEGMTRHVITLPQQADEADFRVELMIGKTVKIDAANRYFFGGQLETESISGWGFERYVLRPLGPMAGTLMAVDPAPRRVDRFIPLGGEAKLLRYNSRLPLVVYVPRDAEVRHRIWRAQPADRLCRSWLFQVNKPLWWPRVTSKHDQAGATASACTQLAVPRCGTMRVFLHRD